MKPPLAPATRVVKIVDLPFEAFDIILRHIKNIREKIRLSCLCKRFRDMVLEHLSRLRYRIVNSDDYLYRSEITRGVRLAGKIMNLSSLLRVAPRLTHFTDKMCQIIFDYTQTLEGARFSALSLKYLRYLHLNLSDFYFFTYKRERQFACRINLFLEDAPQLQTLHITIDHPLEFVLKSTLVLRTFQFDYFLNPKYIEVTNNPICINSIHCYGIIDGSAPNLDELVINTKYMNVFVQLNNILERVTHNCCKLTSLSLFFQSSVWPQIEDLWPNESYGDWYLPNLRYLEIRGVIIPPEYWEMILNACPSLVRCYFSNFSDAQVFHMMFDRNIYTNIDAKEDNQRVTYIRNRGELYEGRFLGPDCCRDLDYPIM